MDDDSRPESELDAGFDWNGLLSHDFDLPSLAVICNDKMKKVPKNVDEALSWLQEARSFEHSEICADQLLKCCRRANTHSVKHIYKYVLGLEERAAASRKKDKMAQKVEKTQDDLQFLTDRISIVEQQLKEHFANVKAPTITPPQYKNFGQLSFNEFVDKHYKRWAKFQQLPDGWLKEYLPFTLDPESEYKKIQTLEDLITRMNVAPFDELVSLVAIKFEALEALEARAK